ncbi:MAG TPA: radical SAM protein [Methanoregulaceae archaeon]|nr:radical SAM protein [Methanoregulaceae archaeon]
MKVKTTRTLCPICNAVLEGTITDEEGSIWLERTCPEHGQFRDLYWSDSALWHKFEQYESLGRGVGNPNVIAPPDHCPEFCGICNFHKSGTLLANIDLTNRCNLDCDFCFANAKACGFVYEPSFEEIVGMLKMLRSQKPVPAPAVQFSGGEPTMRDDVVALVRIAKEVGFPQVQLATNGIKLAKDIGFVEELKAAGLSTVYLHFDGVTRETNTKLTSDKKAVENCEEVGLGLILVPTIIKGRNDHEVGAIIRYAAEHIKVVRGVNFQPIAFTGAASEEDVQRERITIPDLLKDIEHQTEGIIRESDFYPVPCVVPFSDLVETYTGNPQVRFTSHQHCGAATYVFITDDGMVPINRMVDVETFFLSIEHLTEKLKKGGQLNKYKSLIEGIREMNVSFKKSEQGSAAQFWKLIGKTLLMQNFDALREFHWNALFIGTMHFMDRYNYDLSRVQRCCIHYATPDGKLIPFCTYNSGPVYREKVWSEHRK